MYQTVRHIDGLDWIPLDMEGVAIKILYKEESSGAMSVLTRMDPGAAIPVHSHSLADETVFVLEGDFIEEGVSHVKGSVFFGRAQAVHGPHATSGGCLLLTHFSAELDFIL